MRYLITHETTLTFPMPVREHHCELRLVPLSDHRQHCLDSKIEIEPAASLRRYVDGFGNTVHHFAVIPPHDSLKTRIKIDVETLVSNPFNFVPVPPARENEWIGETLRAHPPLWDFVLHRSVFTPDLSRMPHDLSAPKWTPGTPLVETAQNAMEWVAETLEYVPGSSDTDTPLEKVLQQKSGVCQDFAHLMLAVVRGWGVPARYVMGYVDPGYREDEEAEPQATHAWVEVLIPGGGWLGFDAVHQLVANDTYVPVAVGRDYRNAAPQRGTFQGPESKEIPTVMLQVAPQQ